MSYILCCRCSCGSGKRPTRHATVDSRLVVLGFGRLTSFRQHTLVEHLLLKRQRTSQKHLDVLWVQSDGHLDPSLMRRKVALRWSAEAVIDLTELFLHGAMDLLNGHER